MKLATQLGAAAALLAFAGTASAQGVRRVSLGDEVSTSAGYRSVVVEMPLNVMAKETVGRIEYNLGGRASLAVEGMYKPKQEEIDDSVHKTTGESMVAQGKGAALFVARYTDGMTMSGFFWALGVGFRDEQVQWHDKADATDHELDMRLADDNSMMSHLAELKGMTGHLRVGYRYVGTDWPLLIGGYVGVRHFQASVTDQQDEASQDSGQVTYAAMTDREKERLLHVHETAPETAIELGFMF